MVATPAAATTIPARLHTSPIGGVGDVAVEEEAATTPPVAVVQVADRRTHAQGSQGVTSGINAARYALKKVMLLMNVGIASMRIMYQMTSLLAPHITPMTSTQTGIWILCI
jgi:hypothetical protein